MTNIVPVVLCGGSGTRLWPRSRVSKPKPFLPLIGGETLFEATLSRTAKDDRFGDPVIVTGAAHLEHVRAQIGNDSQARIIIEPAALNTAAAIALAAEQLPHDTVMLVCPSDHFIADPAAFRNAAQAGAKLAGAGWLVALGIRADSPETGYGYIKQGEPLEGGFEVKQFVEKPDLARAERFLAEGGYFWNGGIFVFTAGQFLKELAEHRPEAAHAVHEAVAAGKQDGALFYPGAEMFERIVSESVDYAVMENTARAAMVPADMGWSDIGNWQALHAALPHDASGNIIHMAGQPNGDAELVDCTNVFVSSDGPRVSVIGVSDLVIVVDGDEVLVTAADGVQKVGTLFGAKNQ